MKGRTHLQSSLRANLDRSLSWSGIRRGSEDTTRQRTFFTVDDDLLNVLVSLESIVLARLEIFEISTALETSKSLVSHDLSWPDSPCSVKLLLNQRRPSQCFIQCPLQHVCPSPQLGCSTFHQYSTSQP
jgi:hypothetical protein